MPPTRRLQTALALVVLHLSSCSLALRAPGRPAYTAEGTPIEPECSDSKTAPTVDVLVGVTLMILGGVMIACRPEEDVDPITGVFEVGVCGAAITLGIPVVIGGAVDAGIGLYGNSKVNKCRTAKQKHKQRLENMEEQRELFAPDAGVPDAGVPDAAVPDASVPTATP